MRTQKKEYVDSGNARSKAHITEKKLLQQKMKVQQQQQQGATLVARDALRFGNQIQHREVGTHTNVQTHTLCSIARSEVHMKAGREGRRRAGLSGESPQSCRGFGGGNTAR